MQKDVIYIDVEDDITAIIGKVKSSDKKIVALVPPKRIGAIQSAVNLKLVHRAAEQADKRLVIISNNTALMALAGSAGIPVAKNLQSKPELAEITALDIDEGEDVIDGAELPVGDHVKVAEKTVDDSIAPGVGATAVAAAGEKPTEKIPLATAIKAKTAKSGVRVPNFNTFRKKLLLIVLGLVLLVGGLVWALVFAPKATVVVTARTTDAALNSKVRLGSSISTSLKDGTIKSETKTLKKQVSIPFAATGKKDVGEKATGTAQFSTRDIEMLGATIPAGTVLTASSGAKYLTNSDIVFTLANYKGANTSITAVERGSKYNGASGSVSGAPSGVSASITSPTSGGTDKTVTVVTQEDIDKVSGDVNKNEDAELARKELLEQFNKDYVVLESTFKSDSGSVKPSPTVDGESADGRGVLAGEVIYSITAILRSEAAKYLDAYFAQQIDGKSNQKIYANGLSDLSFTNVSEAENGHSANITTNGKIGPKIDENSLKEYAKGKRLGEVQDYVMQIDGVDNVDVKFSPFWVNSVPNDTKKIDVEFKVNAE